MAILRTIKCDIPGCDHSSQEEMEGSGWPGWGNINGISLNGTPNPALCPHHLGEVAEFTDKLKSIEDSGVL